MSDLLDAPAVVLVAVALGTVCFLLEAALPTVGVAGTIALALGGLAVWGIGRQDATWWPLLGVAAAIAVWGAMVFAHRRPVASQAVAGVVFAAGALGFALAEGDGVAVVTALVAAVALPCVFPRIADAADRLDQEPPQVGMEALVGSPATVVEWDTARHRGRVRVRGTLWNATGDGAPSEGEEVVVSAVAGMSVSVEQVPSRRG